MEIHDFAFYDIDGAARKLEEQNAKHNDTKHVVARFLVFVFEQERKRYNDGNA